MGWSKSSAKHESPRLPRFTSERDRRGFACRLPPVGTIQSDVVGNVQHAESARRSIHGKHSIQRSSGQSAAGTRPEPSVTNARSTIDRRVFASRVRPLGAAAVYSHSQSQRVPPLGRLHPRGAEHTHPPPITAPTGRGGRRDFAVARRNDTGAHAAGAGSAAAAIFGHPPAKDAFPADPASQAVLALYAGRIPVRMRARQRSRRRRFAGGSACGQIIDGQAG